MNIIISEAVSLNILSSEANSMNILSSDKPKGFHGFLMLSLANANQIKLRSNPCAA